MIQLVLKRVGQRGNDTKLQAQLEAELLLIQEQLEGGVKCGQMDQGVFMPWFLYKETSALTLLANVETIALPSDFLMEYEELHGGSMWYLASGTWYPIVRDDLDILRARYNTIGTTPTGYDIVGEYIYVAPLVSANVTMRLAYYARDAQTFSTNIENKWAKNAADLLVAELTLAAGRLTSNEAYKTEGIATSKLARDRLYAMHVAREEAGRQRQRGDD